MSRPDFVYWGSIPLKDGVTPADVIATVRREWGPDDEQLPLEVDVIDKNGIWTAPDDWEGWGDIAMTFSPGEVHYNFNGQFHWSFDEEFESWIEDVAQLASAGWESREGNEDEQDEECMVFRGPTPLAIAQAEFEAAKLNLQDANDKFVSAQKTLGELMR